MTERNSTKTRTRERARSVLRLPDSEVDLAYAAGLIDGEGCILPHSKRPNWTVKLASTDEELVDWMLTMGGTTSTENRGGNRKRAYYWYLSPQKQVRLFLLAVLPHMKNVSKREKAKGERSERYRDHVLGSCEACSTEGPMHVHHVDGDHENGDPSSLQTLCAKCHGFWHAALNRTGRGAGRVPRPF